MGDGNMRACQNVVVSGSRWNDLGAPDGLIFFVKEPFQEKKTICAESQTEIDAKAKLNKMITGYCDRLIIVDCDCKKNGEVEVRKFRSLWDRFKSFIGW